MQARSVWKVLCAAHNDEPTRWYFDAAFNGMVNITQGNERIAFFNDDLNGHLDVPERSCADSGLPECCLERKGFFRPNGCEVIFRLFILNDELEIVGEDVECVD